MVETAQRSRVFLEFLGIWGSEIGTTDKMLYGVGMIVPKPAGVTQNMRSQLKILLGY